MPLSHSPVLSRPTLEKRVDHDVLAAPPVGATGGKITIADVARAAGVSTTAVSYALNGKGRIPDATRQSVLEAAKTLGYEANYYAQRIKGGCTKTLACYSETIAGVMGEKVTRIQREFILRGFSAPLHGLGQLSDEAAETIKQLRRQRPRAIVFGGRLNERALEEMRRFRDEAGIAVCYDNPFPPDFEQVNLDRELGAYHATRHLIEKGHRKIGISTHQHTPMEDAFTRGFRRALKEANVPYRDEWYCPFHPFELAGKALAAHFISMTERPTAFYIVDDRMATTFVNYILRGGLEIPRDVSVITHDQAGAAEHCVVPLTVVNHPISQIVDSVVTMVLSRLAEQYDGPPRHAVISGQLVERGSVQTLNV